MRTAEAQVTPLVQAPAEVSTSVDSEVQATPWEQASVEVEGLLQVGVSQGTQQSVETPMSGGVRPFRKAGVNAEMLMSVGVQPFPEVRAYTVVSMSVVE